MEGMFCSGVWFFAATVPGYFPVTELIINSSVYSSIQEANVKPSTYQLKVGSNWVMQSDKQQKADKERKKTKALQWPSYSPDLQIQTVWWDITGAWV